MPYKANAARRHRIPRARYRVTNWPEYDRALQRRGSLTVWVTPEALAAWHPPGTGRRGRSRTYSDLAIETGHLLRLAFGRPWRQTEGLLRSLAALLGLSIGIPDHSTFSRRSPGLTPCCMGRRCGRTEPDPCSGSCDAGVLRASEVEHAVQRVGGDRHLGRLPPVRLEAQPVTDDPLPSGDIGLHQGTPVVPRRPLPAQ